MPTESTVHSSATDGPRPVSSGQLGAWKEAVILQSRASRLQVPLAPRAELGVHSPSVPHRHCRCLRAPWCPKDGLQCTAQPPSWTDTENKTTCLRPELANSRARSEPELLTQLFQQAVLPLELAEDAW